MAAHDRRIQAMARSQLDQFYACACGTEDTSGEPGRLWLGRVLGTTCVRLNRQGRSCKTGDHICVGGLQVDGQI